MTYSPGTPEREFGSIGVIVVSPAVVTFEKVTAAPFEVTVTFGPAAVFGRGRQSKLSSGPAA